MTAADLIDILLVGAALWVWPGTLLRAAWSLYWHFPKGQHTHDLH
jgi:hypothetical protein